MSKFCEWRAKNKKIILKQIVFSNITKMQHEYLSESAVLRINKSPMKKVQIKPFWLKISECGTSFSKTTSRNTERKVLSVVSYFLAYVEINKKCITFVETWAMVMSSKLSSSH
jgi:hypothetical protein